MKSLPRVLSSGTHRIVSDARWRHGVFWPVLVPVSDTWEKYQDSLSRPAKKNLRASLKANADLRYSDFSCDKREYDRFFDIWGRRFPFPDGERQKIWHMVESGRIDAYRAEGPDGVVGIHLVERFGRYARCHAPWFDFEQHEKRGLGSHFWFSLIQHSCSSGRYDWLDLGGGPIRKLNESHYKRRFSPVETSQFVRLCRSCGYNYLVPSRPMPAETHCPECGMHDPLRPIAHLALAISRFL